MFFKIFENQFNIFILIYKHLKKIIYLSTNEHFQNIFLNYKYYYFNNNTLTDK